MEDIQNVRIYKTVPANLAEQASSTGAFHEKNLVNQEYFITDQNNIVLNNGIRTLDGLFRVEDRDDFDFMSNALYDGVMNPKDIFVKKSYEGSNDEVLIPQWGIVRNVSIVAPEDYF